MVVGIGFCLEPHRARVRMAFGAMFIAVGWLFNLSMLSTAVLLPPILDNFLLIVGIFGASQGLFEISLYLFGGEAVPGLRLKVYLVGSLWSLLIWALPLLDWVMKLPVIVINVEDGRPMSLFQMITSLGVYLWPIVVIVLSFIAGRWKPRDIPNEPGAVRNLLTGLAALFAVLLITGIASAFSSLVVYRFGQTLMQALLLLFYFFIRAHPNVFTNARSEIGKGHKRRNLLSDDEARLIELKLQRLLASSYAFGDPAMDLAELSRMIGLPAYRLSMYFNSRLGLGFPAWLNKVRIDYVCSLLASRPGLSILDVAMEAGYASKTVFNTQFQRIVGTKPSEFRLRSLVP